MHSGWQPERQPGSGSFTNITGNPPE